MRTALCLSGDFGVNTVIRKSVFAVFVKDKQDEVLISNALKIVGSRNSIDSRRNVVACKVCAVADRNGNIFRSGRQFEDCVDGKFCRLQIVEVSLEVYTSVKLDAVIDDCIERLTVVEFDEAESVFEHLLADCNGEVFV